MEFKDFHKDFFKAKTGAYSRVTNRENYDSQITLTDVESEIVLTHFGRENIHIGNVSSNRELAGKHFLLYPNFENTTLNLVFPKPNKTELRLYLSARNGFKPNGNEIWFIYIDRYDQLIIGSMDEPTWRSLDQNDIEDVDYQENIESTLIEIPIIDINPIGRIMPVNIAGRNTYARDPRIAALRFDLSGYRCEIDNTHETFIAQRTNKAYVEAHHFIPMKYQPYFEMPLDNLENVISLCPNCHRGIHYGIADHKYSLIETIYEKRPNLHNYSIDDIAQYYNSIKIIDRN